MHRKLESLFDRAGKLVLPRCPAIRGTTRQEIVSSQIRIPARRRLGSEHAKSSGIGLLASRDRKRKVNRCPNDFSYLNNCPWYLKNFRGNYRNFRGILRLRVQYL